MVVVTETKYDNHGNLIKKTVEKIVRKKSPTKKAREEVIAKVSELANADKISPYFADSTIRFLKGMKRKFNNRRPRLCFNYKNNAITYRSNLENSIREVKLIYCIGHKEELGFNEEEKQRLKKLFDQSVMRYRASKMINVK